MAAEPPHLPAAIGIISSTITIRPYHPSDAVPIADHANNRKIWLNMTDRFPHPYTLADSEWWINNATDPANFLSNLSTSDQGPQEPAEAFAERCHQSALPRDYAICHNSVAVGSIGIEYNPRAPRSVTIGYWIGEEFWGKGYMTGILQAWVKYIFDTWPWVVRIDGDAYAWNVGSQKVMMKAGFVKEGVQKMKVYKDGKYGDLVLFGLVREGFQGEMMQTQVSHFKYEYQT